jgi:hypothetical protein
MRCCQYSTLGHYFNIMMPTKKSDFNKQVTESFNKPECDANQKRECSDIGAKKCVIGVNDRAICEVGPTHEYQKNILLKMSF